MRNGKTPNRRGQATLDFDAEPAAITAGIPTPAAGDGAALLAGDDPFAEPAVARGTRPTRRRADADFVDGEAIRRGFGADLRTLLDLATWDRDPDPGETIRSISARARRVVERTRARQEPLRKMVEEQIFALKSAPKWAGFHPVGDDELKSVAQTVLYNGSTEAVCGDYVAHNTVPLAIAQAGVCVVGYSGRQRQWHQRIIREEWEIELDDPDADVEAVFQQRDRLSQPGFPNRMETLNQLARRGFVSYMERLVMLRECPGKWRVGDGVPVPLDLLTGAANMELLEMSLEVMRDLLLSDPRWVFVSHTAREPGLQMIGDALRPMEFVILIRLHTRLREQVEIGRYAQHYGQLAERFVDEVGPHIVLGAFRAGPYSPPWFFFAHEERAYDAGLIVMADALGLQPQGFPPLLRLARTNCHASLGGEAFEQLVRQAYREAGAPEWFLRGVIR